MTALAFIFLMGGDLVTIEQNQAIFALVIPFSLWVTVSLFNQRQEIALLKLSLEELKEIVKTFNCNACHKDD